MPARVIYRHVYANEVASKGYIYIGCLPCAPYVLNFQNHKGGNDFVPPSESDIQRNQCKMQEVLIEIIEIVLVSESALFTTGNV